MSGRAKCPDCGRLVATYTPKAGDGSAAIFRRHVVRLGAMKPKRCLGSGSLVISRRLDCQEPGCGFWAEGDGYGPDAALIAHHKEVHGKD